MATTLEQRLSETESRLQIVQELLARQQEENLRLKIALTEMSGRLASCREQRTRLTVRLEQALRAILTADIEPVFRAILALDSETENLKRPKHKRL